MRIPAALALIGGLISAAGGQDATPTSEDDPYVAALLAWSRCLTAEADQLAPHVQIAASDAATAALGACSREESAYGAAFVANGQEVADLLRRPFYQQEAERRLDRMHESYREILVHRVIYIRLHGSPPPPDKAPPPPR